MTHNDTSQKGTCHKIVLVTSVVDPHSYFADPDLAKNLSADPDPGCQSNVDPDPGLSTTNFWGY